MLVWCAVWSMTVIPIPVQCDPFPGLTLNGIPLGGIAGVVEHDKRWGCRAALARHPHRRGGQLLPRRSFILVISAVCEVMMASAIFLASGKVPSVFSVLAVATAPS